MTAAEPREIRLSEIPTELRNLRADIDRWREAHARQLTRAGELEKEVSALTLGLGKAIYARDAARQTCDDLTDHCTRQGQRIADLEADLARAQALGNLDHQRRLKAERRASEYQAAHETLVDMLGGSAWSGEPIGEECDVCRGTGKDYDIEPVHLGGPTNDYREKTIEVDCTNCFGGWLPKGSQR